MENGERMGIMYSEEEEELNSHMLKFPLTSCLHSVSSSKAVCPHEGCV